MAEVLAITTIKATPQLATQRSDGNVSVPGIEETIFTPGPDYNDHNGSKFPITYQSTTDAARINPALKLNGSIFFSKAWAGKSYFIKGSLNIAGTSTPILISSQKNAPLIIPDPGILEILTDVTYSFENPTPGMICPVPFHLIGDFEWTVTTDTPIVIRCLTPTRLELNWAIASAPSGPVWAPNKTDNLNVDLGATYPIGLLRFFLPTNMEVPAGADFATRYRKWWSDWIMNKIWNYGNPSSGASLQYDSAGGGGSSYNVGQCGGSFDLKNWVYSPKPFLNCYDLAAIAQLGCCLLVATDSSDALQSLWVYQNPYGYILPGALYGWAASGLCNNPFWQFNAPTIGTTNILTANGSTRSSPKPNTRWPFGNHAWVEVDTGPDSVGRKVLDATVANWGPPQNPEVGTRNRTNYQDTHVDKPAGSFGNLDPYISTAPGSLGNCYLNDTFTLAYTYPGKPSTGMPRVGVYSANGLMPPVSTLSTVSFPIAAPVPVPAIASVPLTSAASSQVQPLSRSEDDMNDAPFTEATIRDLVAPDTNLEYQTSDLRLSPGVTKKEFVFRDPLHPGDEGDLSVIIQVFDSVEQPAQALAADLSGFQLDLALISKPLPTPIGSQSLRTPRNVYFTKGNVLVKLAFHSLQPPNDDAFAKAITIAQRIDSHMTKGTNGPSFRSPSTDLSKLVKTVKAGEPFSLECSAPDDFANLAVCSSSNPGCILPAGPAKHGVFTLHPLEKGTADITFTVAHSETLQPSSRTISIKVE